MRKHIINLLFILLAFLVGRASNPPSVKAQLPANAVTIVGGGPVSTCAKPIAGLVFLCVGTDDIIASKNGSVPISMFSVPVAAGVTSISVNGSAPLSGAISLTIPSKASTVSTTTIQ